MILGEGRGFEIAQGRLGPGRLHHCMRVIGIGQAALALAVQRIGQRSTFGKLLAERSLMQAQIAERWIELHSAWCALNFSQTSDQSFRDALIRCLLCSEGYSFWGDLANILAIKKSLMVRSASRAKYCTDVGLLNRSPTRYHLDLRF